MLRAGGGRLSVVSRLGRPKHRQCARCVGKRHAAQLASRVRSLSTLFGMPIKWRGTSRRPIPENWHSVGQRSSPYHLGGNRNAAHPVNAILNYAYAALESEIRIKTISDGYDPTIGIMHEGSDGSSKFIFDLMESERPRIDRAVLEFVRGHVFDPADFVIRSDGVCRLNPKMARMVVAKVSS
jgi:CRISPR-associated protein Cas1